jgi:hypothetical protein
MVGSAVAPQLRKAVGMNGSPLVPWLAAQTDRKPHSILGLRADTASVVLGPYRACRWVRFHVGCLRAAEAVASLGDDGVPVRTGNWAWLRRSVVGVQRFAIGVTTSLAEA